MTDQVDSVNIVADDEGKVVTRTEYLPYGETWISEGETRNRPKYNSQELDAETGFYFYNARHYDPEICRFVTADNVIDGEYDTQGWNRFSYCHGNPIVYKDPSGHSGEALSGIFNNALNDLDDRYASQLKNVESNNSKNAQDIISKMGIKLEKGQKAPGWVNGEDSARLFKYLETKTGDKEIDAQKATIRLAIDSAYTNTLTNISKYGDGFYGSRYVEIGSEGKGINPFEIRNGDKSLGYIGSEKKRLDDDWQKDQQYKTNAKHAIMNPFTFNKDRARVYKNGENEGLRFDNIHFSQKNGKITVHYDRFNSNTWADMGDHIYHETSKIHPLRKEIEGKVKNVP